MTTQTETLSRNGGTWRVPSGEGLLTPGKDILFPSIPRRGRDSPINVHETWSQKNTPQHTPTLFMLSSKELAKQLAEIGHKITDATVRKDWSHGAPRSSAEAFLRWKNRKRATTVDPEIRELKATKLKGEIKCLRIRAEREQQSLDENGRRLVDVNVVHAEMDRCLAKARAILDAKFHVELPPKQDGMPAAKIAEMNRDALDSVYSIIGSADFWRKQ